MRIQVPTRASLKAADAEMVIDSAAWLEFYEKLTKQVNAPYTLATYANNVAALAGGLTAGELYKTSIGSVMVVY